MAERDVEYVFVCTGPTCGERGGNEILRTWKSTLVRRHQWATRRTVSVKCFDQCALGPNVCSWPDGRFESGVDPKQCEHLLDAMFATRVAPE